MSAKETSRTVLVLIASSDIGRQCEALRSAIGLSLRGSEVSVHFASPPSNEAMASRHAGALADLGYPVTSTDSPNVEPPAIFFAADTVEVWS